MKKMKTRELYVVSWKEPGGGSQDSMPLGNGDLGINLWTEQNGDILFYIGTTDAFDEYCRLLKLGKIRISMEPNLLLQGNGFEQILDMYDGILSVKNDVLLMNVWIASKSNQIVVEVKSDVEVKLSVQMELWRKKSYEVKTETGDVYKNLTGPDLYKTIVTPDKILDTENETIGWLHYNQFSTYEECMKLQGLGEISSKYQDILLHRGFGCLLGGDGFRKDGKERLISEKKAKKHKFVVTSLTTVEKTEDEWHKMIQEKHTEEEEFFDATRDFWNSVWEKSYIYLSGDETCEAINKAYIMQRFLNVASGNGTFPLKYNGSIFTVDYEGDPDYRRWGAGFWFQNTRLSYWPMLAAGDFKEMLPFFKMYRNALELLKDRNQIYYHHPGIHNSETVYPWGIHVNGHYGWDREGHEPDYIECTYVSYYWQSGIELVEMMLSYFSYTGDEAFARDIMLPYAAEIIMFYMYHYSKDEDEKLIINPASSLETWHIALNPTPEIAGLTSITKKIMQLSVADETLKENCKGVLESLPELPLGEIEGRKVILPAKEYDMCKNIENPELYTVFPYRQFGIGKENLQLAQDTFDVRRIKIQNCWHQDDIQAAYLGRAEETYSYLYGRTKGRDENSKFAGFWEAYNDWVPDMDHGGVLMMALQSTLIQSDAESGKIHIFPAFPKRLDVRFRLYADQRTLIEGCYEKGQLKELNIFPKERAKDIVFC